jgi:hypothetical protein
MMLFIPMGKTGGRPVRLYESERHLRNWLLDHPQKSDMDAWLWVNINKANGPESRVTHKRHERLDYGSFRTLIQRKALQAGVKVYQTLRGAAWTHVTPYLFRHSRMTELHKRGMTEQVMKKFAGWSDRSRSPATYVHLSAKDVDDSLLRIHGIEPKDGKPKTLQCQICAAVNPAENEVCRNCIRPLRVEVAVRAERVEQARQAYTTILEAITDGKTTKEQVRALALELLKAASE